MLCHVEQNIYRRVSIERPLIYSLTVTSLYIYLRHFDQIRTRPLHTRAAHLLDGVDAIEHMTPSSIITTHRHISCTDLVDHIRRQVSRYIDRNAYMRGPLAVLVLNAPASLRFLVVSLNELVERGRLALHENQGSRFPLPSFRSTYEVPMPHPCLNIGEPPQRQLQGVRSLLRRSYSRPGTLGVALHNCSLP